MNDKQLDTAIRIILLCGVVIMLIGSPLYSDDVASELPVQIVAAIGAVALAAFIGHKRRFVRMTTVAVLGAATILFQVWAVLGYMHGEALEFMLRQLLAVISLAGFYFGVLSVRAHSDDSAFDGAAINHRLPHMSQEELDPLAEEEKILEDDRGESN